MRIFSFFFLTRCRWLLAIVFVLILLQPGYAQTSLYIPEVLESWKNWVLHGKEKELTCVPQYNDPNIYQCAWPSRLEISLDDHGGEFRQSWMVNYETWVRLPGSSRHWPGDIRVDGEARIVIEKNKGPEIQLKSGLHTVTGRFVWQRLPEKLKIPSDSGLLSLTLNDEQIQFPDLDTNGRLWLKRLNIEKKIENRLKIDSFRLIEDLIPARVLLHITLDVAGSPREISLGPLYSPDKFRPVSLKSPLPARLEQDATMRVQVRPGRYNLNLDLRHAGPLHDLQFNPPDSGIWPKQEIWSFRAQPDLRLVEVKGVSAVDPLQTSLPKAWQKYPAYMMLPRDRMNFKEIKRGDPQPAPDQLTLNRTLWLRFDGSGYAIQDTINGQKNTNWRLEIDPAIKLGRVSVDGKAQFITQRKGSDKAGIELRNGRLNFTADSIYQGKISVLPAVGWDHDFQKVTGRIHLPPGWKLLNATGIDNIHRTWIKQWTLLDFFIVLIFTISLARLFSKRLAVIAFLTLVLIFHEPNAPRYIWLALLIGFVLLKYLPEGAFKKIVKVYQGLAILAFVVIVIPYAAQALRIGIYPQLARPWTSMTRVAAPQQISRSEIRKMDAVQDNRSLQPEALSVVKSGRKLEKKGKALVTSSVGRPASSYLAPQVMQHDPNALTQTGPGMPEWSPFETIRFSWSGPVTRDQKIAFTLIGPKINLILSFVRVLFILLLAMGMFGVRYRGGRFSVKRAAALTAVLVPVLLVFSPNPAHTTEIPSPQILDELQNRLLEKDECFPSCADISNVMIDIDHEQLSIIAHISAQLDSAIPVPGHAKHWLPGQVMIDNTPAMGLFRKKNGLWVMIPKGRHVLELKGPVRHQSMLQLLFPLKPHHARIRANGWSVEGIDPDGTIGSQLQFKRISEQDDKLKEILETGILPPFAQVERTLLLGLVWKIHTTVQRVGSVGSGMVMDIPLLPGESVTTDGIRVVGNVAKINLRSDQVRIAWESFLEPVDSIRLDHETTNEWAEIWRVNVSPIYHMEYDGIHVILHKTGNRWHPTWHPWPGETVHLKISRPQGVEGQTLTFEKNHLELRPGRHTTAAEMFLSIKSSQGGQHTISLPQDAKLQEVKIAGRIQPIRQEGQQVTLPITPGIQAIALKWVESKGMSARYQSPRVDLGLQNVNTSVDIVLPRNRWPLFLGGDHLVGPAVLFWSVLITVILVAFGLSKTGWTPLKFYHWFLLGIGMSMSNLAAGIFVAGWLIALAFRNKADTLKGASFNLVQIGIVLLTIAATGSLVFAISGGLLGHPDMNIIGNGSNAGLLKWYHDVSDRILPQAWVISIPMTVYRIAMLGWALWVSFWLIGILKWGWQQFATPVLWQKLPPWTRKKKKKRPTDDSVS